ncbi:hypothetical protein [Fimbriimonas ginsengisoli]|uniref:Uncharacterized protein n=1 Tax=Fimbriimonas ginsengisoli Gsoil 348 TaxID=661478 RepID=A0A068NZ26_FIMGI|nr:hypothetical protein [Fimbriimonas ginsengisoli]AIE87839.1 hypothetical protein OP10G_4471 [Fimbriimonas ginsengisoli Gsoil 348]
MKRYSKILVLAGMAFASVAFVRQDGLVLRLTLKENSVDTYKIESKVKQTMSGTPAGDMEMGINSSTTYKITTGKVDAEKGKADVTVETTYDKLEADGPIADMINNNKPKPSSMKGTLDSLGHLELDKAKLAQAMVQMGAAQQAGPNPVFVDFPEKAVKIGDTWDVIVPKSQFTGPTDQKLTSKLVGEKKLDDKDVWIVSTSGPVKFDVDTSKLPKPEDTNNPMAQMSVHVKGTVDMTVESLVEKSTGKVLRSETKGKSKSTVEIADAGLTIESSATTTTIATLQPAK